MPKSNFFKSYWPVVLLAGATALPRLLVTPRNISEHVSSIIPQPFLDEFGLTIAFLILLSGLFYWFFEYLGYRFNFLLKTVHLVFSYPLLLLVALLFYNYQYENRISGSGSETTSIGELYNRPEWLEKLFAMNNAALAMFLPAQILFVVHLIVVLFKGRNQTGSNFPEPLDRLS